MSEVAALFVRHNSVYKTMAGVDAWDKTRDARNFPGGKPVVAHPPCRMWARFAWRANGTPEEKALGIFALDTVDREGGVVEHPWTSHLWEHCVGRPGKLTTVDQQWWGHRAQKRTTLYIVGIELRDVPPFEIDLKEATHIVAGAQSKTREEAYRRRKGWPSKPSVTKAEREHTPPAFAHWLVEVARRCSARAKGDVT